MNDRDRIISKIQMMASKAFYNLGSKEIAYHEDNAVSVEYMGYTVKISIDATLQRKAKKANQRIQLFKG